MSIKAPYNFVPLSKWVFEQKADKTSHDIPFKKGINGSFNITIKTQTSLLIGTDQDKRLPNSREPADIHPFYLPNNGGYAIPGTSIKGLVRNVLEIASFSKLNAVDDTRFGLRDIGGAHVRDLYAKTILKKDHEGFIGPRAGWLRMRQDGSAEITPCEYVRISHRDIENYLNYSPNILFKKHTSVAEKYKQWRNIAQKKLKRSLDNACDISFNPKPADDPTDPTQHNKATDLFCGKTQGTLVFTGQISDKTDDRPKTGQKKASKGKYLDFVFYDNKPDRTLVVEHSTWSDFRFIHGEEEKKNSKNMSWPGYWHNRFFQGEEVPVFYRLNEDNTVASLGLAYMYKIAFKHSVLETISHTSDKHLSKEFLDFTQLIFGTASDNNSFPLKGRVSFGLARTNKKLTPKKTAPVIPGSPKPSYFPNYIKQNRTDSSGKKLADNMTTYATYMQDTSEIRGWKRYPANSENIPTISDPTQKKNGKIQAHLFPLPAQSEFKGKVRIHNLKPVELGGLLWAMTWGDNPELRHSLGMGKPYGLGQISITLDESWGQHLRSNSEHPVPSPFDCMTQFIEYMSHAYSEAHAGEAWLESEQLTQLLAMADPKQAPGQIESLSYMPLKQHQKAKNSGQVLPPYVKNMATSSPWLDEQLKLISSQHNIEKFDEVLRGKILAEKWQQITDSKTKAQALKAIKKAWQAEGRNWWNTPPGRGAKRVKAMYTKKNTTPA